MPDVIMPRLSDTMTEGVISQWLKAEGDQVERGETLAEIETDKATMELEAYESGVLTRIIAAPGSTVPIGESIAVIGEPSSRETEPSSPGAAPAGNGTESDGNGATSASERASAPGPDDDAGSGGDAAAPVGPEPSGQPRQGTAGPAPHAANGAPVGSGTVRTSPLARALAREHGLDLADVAGTGPGGRIVRADIEAAVATGKASAASPAASAPAPVAASGAPVATPDDERIPLSSIRRITAQRLTESAAAPHFYLTSVVEMAALTALRAELNAALEGSGTKLSVTDLLVRACALTLRAHPEVNASWGGDHVLRHGHVNVGIAVALESGLIVPVVRDADAKTVAVIAARARELATRARAGKLTPDEFSGGTFTVSNLGMFGVEQFTAVINPPEAAILAVGATRDEAILRDGQLVNVPRMRVTLTVDHRVLDGAGGAAFLRDLVDTLEHPLRILV